MGAGAGGGRIRVLRVIARLNLGGPAHQAILLSGRRLDPERFETLLVHGSLAAGEESMADLLEAEGVRARYVGELVQPVAAGSDLRALRALRSIVREFRPEIVHTHTAKAGFVGRQAALSVRRGRPALVHTFHGHVLEGYFGAAKERLFRGLERWLAQRTDVLIGVSRTTVDDLVRLGVAERDRFRVVPLGLDLSGFVSPPAGSRERVRAELGIDADEVLVSFVGRVVPIKRLDVLLEAIAGARGRGAPVRLALAGDGEIRAELEAQAAALGIGDAVRFLGYRRDLAELAAASDLAVLSSANEGTPVSLIEAAAAGRPAVATRVGGVGEVVLDGESGLLVAPGDVEGLAAGIARLAADAELRRRMGERARKHALERFSIERLLADVAAIYEELAGSLDAGA